MRLGTCVKIEATLSIAPATCKITIVDPAETDMVVAADMTMVTAAKYRYIYQSAETDVPGRYVATIKAVTGDPYEAVTQAFFTLLSQE